MDHTQNLCRALLPDDSASPLDHFYLSKHYVASEKLKNKTFIITGIESFLSQALAYTFLQEQANVILIAGTPGLSFDETNLEYKFKDFSDHISFASGNIHDADFCKNIINKAKISSSKIDGIINNFLLKQIDTLEKDWQQLVINGIHQSHFHYFNLIENAYDYLSNHASIINTINLIHTDSDHKEGLLSYLKLEEVIEITKCWEQLLMNVVYE